MWTSINKKITRNIFISILAQIISLAVSFVINLVVPKFISEIQYAYWQTYILYVGYVGVLHFGLLDGIVLRYSQYDYEELDKERIRSQFKLLLYSTSVIAITSILLSCVFFSGIMRSTAVLVSIGIITKNIFTYNSYAFQITNRISKYASLVIVQRMSYGVMALLLIFMQVDSFEWFCIIDLVGDLVGIILSAFINKGMCFGKTLQFKEAFSEWKDNVSSGVILLFANWLAMLLLGSAKMIIQWHWGEFVFGKIAFAFSISNLFLTFVTAISVVLFPSLKRMELEQLPNLYCKIRGAISPFFFSIMLLYFPICFVLKNLLPAYEISLKYLATLLPIIIYSAKVSLLTNNYLKAYRKERTMLLVNIVSVIFAVALVAIGAYALDNLDMVLLFVVASIMLNSILSEFIVMRIIKKSFIRDLVVEAFLTIAFILFPMFVVHSFIC